MIGTQVRNHLSMSPADEPPPWPAPAVLVHGESWPSSHRLGVMKLKLGVVATDLRSVTRPVTPDLVPAGMAPVVVPRGTTSFWHLTQWSMIEWKYMNGSWRVV